LSTGLEILGNLNAVMCGEPLNMSMVYSTTVILMMYSPSEKSKHSHDFFQNFKAKDKILVLLHSA